MADTTTAPSTANATNNNNKDSSNTNNNSNSKPNEYNPRWKGYVYILLASLVNFSSVSNLELENNPSFQGMWQISLVFGLVTFVATVVILLLDRFQNCCRNNADDSNNNNINNDNNKQQQQCHFAKAMDGRFEGYTLMAFTLWWIVGVAHITQVGGVAYSANNIYFSSWLNLVACVYTLDQWSSSKDIISIHELTGVSATLKSWYLLFLSSLVTMGTSSDIHRQVAQVHKSDSSYGIVFGLFSTLASLFWILVHYRLIDFECLQVGGWIELSSSFVMIMVWIVGVSVLTQEGGIAATIGGTGCTDRRSEALDIDFGEGCYVIWVDQQEESEDASSINEDNGVPGTEGLDSSVAGLPSSSPSMEPSFVPSLRPSTASSLYGSNETDDAVLLGNITNYTLVDEIEANLIANGTDGANNTTTEANVTVSGTAANNTTTEANVTANETVANNTTEANISANGTGANNTTEANVTANNTVTNDTIQRQLQEQVPLESQTPPPSVTSSNTTADPLSATPSDMPSSIPSRPPSMMPSSFPSAAPSMGDPGVACKAILENQVPGSNLYFSVWICFFASFNVTLRWKAAQAMNFAKAQNRRAVEHIEVADGDHSEDDEDGEDDNDEDDDSSIPYNLDDDI